MNRKDQNDIGRLYTEDVQGVSGKKYSSLSIALGEYVDKGFASKTPNGAVAGLIAMVNKNLEDNKYSMEGIEPKAFVAQVKKVSEELGAGMPPLNSLADFGQLLNDVGEAIGVDLVYDYEHDLVYAYSK